MPDNNLYEPDKLPMPIAANGDYIVIPENQAVAGDGKASISLGFGPENAKIIDDGGKAVRRQDLNGLFNRLSQILYWVQSGGQWTYSTDKNYTTNCMVIHNNQFFVCVADNGPSYTTGLHEPGTNDSYWKSLSNFGNFVTSGSTVDNIKFAVDGLNASFNLSGSTQGSISPSANRGYFSMSTFSVNSSSISAGTYDIKDILQRLINNSHTHSSRTISSSLTDSDKTAAYCSYCSYCSYCCRDCTSNCDCGDDTCY